MFDLYIQEALEDMDGNEDGFVTLEEYIGASIIVNNNYICRAENSI